nr:EOG090X07NA [Eulimnadia texana]
MDTKNFNNEDDDPVVKEIPVYLSKALQENLYLFQYPLKTFTSSNDAATVLSAKIKPKQQQVELEFGLVTRSANYDQSRGEQIAINVDGADRLSKNEENFYKSSVMDKMVFTSSQNIKDASSYAAGFLVNNELHITPLAGIVSMKPSFSFLDKSDKKLKEEARDLGADAGESADEEEGVQQVTVKFARTENERFKKAREKSFDFLQKKSAEEPWYNTNYHHSNSEESLLGKARLMCEKSHEEVSVLVQPAKNYIQSLVPPDLEIVGTEAALPSNVVSLAHIKNLPLVDQVKAVMINAKLMSFQQLLILLGQQKEASQMLRAVQQVAVLIQGNWVVRSDVLYPKDKLCGLTGVPAEIITKARDLLLLAFTQSRFVDKKSMMSVLKMPPEEVSHMFQEISIYRTGKGWEFALPTDEDFLKKYPEIVQRQDMLWKAKQQLSQQLSADSGGFKTPKREPMDAASKNRRQRRRSRKDSCSSDSGSENKK